MNNVMKKFSSDTLMNRFFRRVNNVCWDLMSGRIGVQTADGIASIEGEGDDAQINVNFFDEMAVAIPAFAQSTPKDSVVVGDMIYTTGDTPGWVVSKTDKNFSIMRPNGTIQRWTPPKVQMFGLDSGVMVVRSLTAMLPGGTGGLANMQGMLLPLMAMGGEDLDLEKMLPMMLMMQTGAAGGTTDGNAMGNMMQTMMLMKMLGGDKGGSPFDTVGRSKSTPFRGN